MSAAGRYLWHQRLAWLLMAYVSAIGFTIAPESAFGGFNIGLCLGWLMVCAFAMACVKDSALCGRPIPFAWRAPIAGTWPVSVPIVEWRARRWWGLAWVALHVFLMLVIVIVANLCVFVLSEFL